MIFIFLHCGRLYLKKNKKMLQLEMVSDLITFFSLRLTCAFVKCALIGTM